MFSEASTFLKDSTILDIQAIHQAGSDRSYQRIVTDKGNYILCHNSDQKENETFFYLTELFKSIALPVPELYCISSDRTQYLLSDEGYECLLDRVLAQGYTSEVYSLYQSALSTLAYLQVRGNQLMDYTHCVAAQRFDKQAVINDLNYFKQYFLDFHAIAYDSKNLELEFHQIAENIDAIQDRHLMYRDFQGRNILLNQHKIAFIDYQGVMQGPLVYDVASLLWQAKAALPTEWKKSLYNYYKDVLSKYTSIQSGSFDTEYSIVVLVRLLQVLGAYGKRGLVEQKQHFIQSIPLGLQHLAAWNAMYQLSALPILQSIIYYISTDTFIAKYNS